MAASNVPTAIQPCKKCVREKKDDPCELSRFELKEAFDRAPPEMKGDASIAEVWPCPICVHRYDQHFDLAALQAAAQAAPPIDPRRGLKTATTSDSGSSVASDLEQGFEAHCRKVLHVRLWTMFRDAAFQPEFPTESLQRKFEEGRVEIDFLAHLRVADDLVCHEAPNQDFQILGLIEDQPRAMEECLRSLHTGAETPNRLSPEKESAENANRYIICEAKTSSLSRGKPGKPDGTVAHLKQLERNIEFLMHRQQNRDVLSVVALAGVAVPTSSSPRLLQQLSNSVSPKQFPQLHLLKQNCRFFSIMVPMASERVAALETTIEVFREEVREESVALREELGALRDDFRLLVAQLSDSSQGHSRGAAPARRGFRGRGRAPAAAHN